MMPLRVDEMKKETHPNRAVRLRPPRRFAAIQDTRPISRGGECGKILKQAY